jgi:hypothetical protein
MIVAVSGIGTDPTPDDSVNASDFASSVRSGVNDTKPLKLLIANSPCQIIIA